MRYGTVTYALLCAAVCIRMAAAAGAEVGPADLPAGIESAYGIDTPERRQALREIEALRREGRWQEMANACSNAVSMFPSPIYFQRWLTAAERVGQPPLLLHVYSSYMNACPDYRPQLYGPWSVAMRNSGRGRDAAERLREWTGTGARDQPLLWKALAELLVAMDRPDEAEDVYRESIVKLALPGWKTAAMEGIARIEESRRNARKAIEAAEKDADASFKHGLQSYARYTAVAKLLDLLRKEKRLDSYIAKMERRVDTGDRPAEALATLVQIADFQRDPKRELDACCRLARMNVDIDTLARCRDVIARNMATNDEIVVTEKIAANPASRQRWLPRLAELYLATGATNKATSALDEMAAKSASADMVAYAADIALSANMRDRATKWVDDARKMQPPDGVKCRIAGILVALGRCDEALDCIMSVPPTYSFPQSRTAVMDDLCKAGYRTNIAERLRQLTDAQPTNTAAWAERARFCHRAGDYTNAAACWKRVTELAPTAEAFRSWIASVRAQGNTTLLAAALETSFQAYPRPDIAASLVPLLTGAGRVADALKIQRKLVETAKTPYEKTASQLGLIRLLVADRQTEEAAKLIAEVQGTNPPEATRREMDEIRATMDANRRHDEFVRNAIDRADRDRSDATAQRSAAQALRMTGRPGEAAAYYRRALAVDDQAATRWDLAYVLTSAKQHREAVEEYRVVLSRDPSQQERETAIKAITDGLAAIGDTRKAIEFLGDRLDEIKTPGARKWATSRIQELRGASN